ncbi:DMT family transporter [Snodgrassella gandavensis]|uniref:DMT family transporter n=1 Tax=Snodgrassella gandavensis TaxID=2946698 RepID=UPI001EF66A9B|nr:DMT family transporter [Snodgrassella gandavensis]
MSKSITGIFFALSAAALNGSIGMISKLLMSSGLNAYEIAFYKTLIATVFVSLLVIRVPFNQQMQMIAPKTDTSKIVWLHIALCSLFGIFTLFFFETLAYGYGFAANVVVVVMTSAAITALFFGWLLLGEKITIPALVGTGLAIAGISIISWSEKGTLLLLTFAATAGLGYGLFSVLVKKFRLSGGIYLTRLLLLFGVFYLALPYTLTVHSNPLNMNWPTITGLSALAVLPTILGFYCTTKALSCLSAARVQVTELAEPIFAMMLGWLFLHEIPTTEFFSGALLIILGILLINGIFDLLYKNISGNFGSR